MREITYVEAVREAQAEALAADDRVFVMGQEIGEYGGVFRATQGLAQRFGAHRVRDMPIAEQSMLGAGVGAAVMGMRPIVEVMFMDSSPAGWTPSSITPPRCATCRAAGSGRRW